jgi:hypothetical protein
MICLCDLSTKRAAEQLVSAEDRGLQPNFVSPRTVFEKHGASVA